LSWIPGTGRGEGCAQAAQSVIVTTTIVTLVHVDTVDVIAVTVATDAAG
jgi:hypothetical protein